MSRGSVSAHAALKRLQMEWKSMIKSPVEGVSASPAAEDELFRWNVLIVGPEDTPYAQGCFRAELRFPPDYPMSPPTMRFVTPILHPNIYGKGPKTGEVCVSILHAGEDATGYESVTERWTPVHSVRTILISVLSLLAAPNDESPANVDASSLRREQPERFRRVVRRQVEASLGLR